ncbi:MAG: hypothetical protein JXJ19_05070, partial [Elusimicrobia bacterium]|nr:hypothetical protein [Elusimicrobiota bacterium]
MPREIKENVILEVSREETKKGDPIIIRVVSWNNGVPKLEKRSFWTNEQGEQRAGKIVGLTEQDFRLLVEKKDEVIEALSGEPSNTES